MKRGRPSIYTPELAELICERLANGQSLRAICREPGMPDESTVRGWVLDNVHDFYPQYARAKEIQAHVIADELLEIADDGRNDWMATQQDQGGEAWRLNGEHVSRSRLRSDTRKWLLSKMLPKVYGDKLDVDSTVRGKVEMIVTGVRRGADIEGEAHEVPTESYETGVQRAIEADNGDD